MMGLREKINAACIAKIVAAVLVAVLSFTVIAEKASAPETYTGTMEVLDEKKLNVMGLTATIVGASTTISMLPDDIGTPVAEQIMDLSDWLLAVLCVIYLEKYILTIVGAVVFKALLPAGCVLFVVGMLTGSPMCRMLWKKICVLGLVFLLAIPAGVKASGMIENAYQASVTASAEAGDELAQIMEADADAEEKENMFVQLWDKVKGGAEEKLEQAKEMLNRFIEQVAVMVVTSCLIPVAVLLFMFWVGKSIIGMDISLPKRERLPIGKHSHREEEE